MIACTWVLSMIFFWGGFKKIWINDFGTPEPRGMVGHLLWTSFFSVTVGAWRLLSSSAPQARRQGKQTIQEFVAFGF